MKNLLMALKDNDGATLKNYQRIEYKTGYQVADTGVECKTIEAAAAAIEKYNGDCGVWKANNIFYIDHSFRVKTKKEALTIGKAHNQICVFKWADKSLVYC